MYQIIIIIRSVHKGNTLPFTVQRRQRKCILIVSLRLRCVKLRPRIGQHLSFLPWVFLCQRTLPLLFFRSQAILPYNLQAGTQDCCLRINPVNPPKLTIRVFQHHRRL